jgi:hypothetical protein
MTSSLTTVQTTEVTARATNNPSYPGGNVCQRNLPGCTQTTNVVETAYPIKQLQQFRFDINTTDVNFAVCNNCSQNKTLNNLATPPLNVADIAGNIAQTGINTINTWIGDIQTALAQVPAVSSLIPALPSMATDIATVNSWIGDINNYFGINLGTLTS